MELNQAQADIYCGIDISKDSFDFCFLTQNKEILHRDHLPMTRNSFNQIITIADKYVNQKIIFLMESTGTYHRRLQYFLENKGCYVSIVMPLLINSFTKASVLRNTKTDKKDALIIAEYGVVFWDKLRASSTIANDLRNLLRSYKFYVKERTRIKVKLQEAMVNCFPEFAKKIDVCCVTALKFLLNCCTPTEIKSKQLRTLDKLLTSTTGRKLSVSASEVKEMARTSIGTPDQFAQFTINHLINSLLETMSRIKDFEQKLTEVTDELFKEEKEILTSVRGIGNISAISFLIEIVDVNNYKNWKQLCAFAGLDPGKKESGSSIKQNGRISKKGNKYLRSDMYVMAQRVTMFCERYKDYKLKKLSEGKKKKQALIAVANKLIKLLFYMLINGVYYEENYESRLLASREAKACL
jgi:transposase